MPHSPGPIPVGVYLICKNEQRHLARALASVADFAEIVVVDSGSTDGTLEIARRHAGKVLHRDWQGFSKQKQFALDQCASEWVLNLDADEEVPPELAAELAQLAREGKHDAYEVPIDDVVAGKRPPASAWTHAKVRFFRRAAGRYGEEAVHEGVRVAGSVGRTKHRIIHHGVPNLAVKTAKSVDYARLRAAERFRKGRKPSGLKLAFAFPWAFFRSYFLRRACLNGWRGLGASVGNAYYAFLKEAMLFEMHAGEYGEQKP